MRLRIKITLLVATLIFIWACDDILEVPDISDQEITVLAPLDGTSVGNNQVNFNWNALEDVDGYRVQVASPNFENASQFLLDSLFAKDTLGALNTRLSLTLLNGNYQWRIKGVNSGYETAFSSHGFLVNGDPDADLIPPNTPSLIGPPDETVQDNTTVSFSWSRDDINGSAERDSIYIYTDEALQNLSQKALGANKNFDATLEVNTYYWLVQAFDAAGNSSADSEVFTLTIN